MMARPRERGAAWVARWWRGEAGWTGAVLSAVTWPAEIAYRVAVGALGAAYGAGYLPVHRATVPVISVGNLTVGGAGKTPVTRWLVGELLARGARPAVLHGGYGEDEPMLHRQWNPEAIVIVNRDRVLAATEAARSGATVIVLDDGFQHRRLARDVDLVLLAAEAWDGHPRLLPRGGWREPLEAMRRATMIAVTRRVASESTAEEVAASVRGIADGVPVVRLYLAPSQWLRVSATGATQAAPPVGEVVAVAGIARPDWFVANARSAGARVAAMMYFPDHHRYTAADVSAIRDQAGGRPVVTTSKDAVKLVPLVGDLDLYVLEQRVIPEAGEAALARMLDGVAA